jgi:hypothetical protein
LGNLDAYGERRRTDRGSLEEVRLKLGKIIPIRALRLGPTQFQAEVERLQRGGKMPSLEVVLAAVAEAREIYRLKILAARKTRRVR